MIVRFFLSFFIFLLNGYSQLYAHSDQPFPLYSENCTFSGSELISLTNVKNDKIFDFKSTSLPTEKESGRTDFTKAEDKVEDNESIICKKYIEVSNYFTAFLFTQVNRLFYQRGKTTFRYIQNSLNSFPCRYLTFCNLRI